MSYVRVQAYGYVARDVDIRVTPSGYQIITFSIRHSVKKKGKDEFDTSFFDCTQIMAGDKTGPALYLKKGDTVFIDGNLKQERWEDKTTGAKRSRTVIMCDRVYCLKESTPSGLPPEAAPDEDITDDNVPF